MKEIKYDGDLETDLEFLNKQPFNILTTVTNIAGSIFLISLVGFISLCFGARIQFMDCVLFGSGVSITFGVAAHIFLNKMLVNGQDIAKDNLDSLVHDLKREECFIEKHDLEKSVQVVKNNSVYSYACDNPNESLNDSERIENYFYFLDNKDKIQILKQVRTFIGESDDIDTHLYLLEDEDKFNEKVPSYVYKKLKK